MTTKLSDQVEAALTTSTTQAMLLVLEAMAVADTLQGYWEVQAVARALLAALAEEG